MGMFKDWVEKKVDEVQRISDRDLAGSDLRVNPPSVGMGTGQDPYGTQQITRGGGMPDPLNNKWYRDGHPEHAMDDPNEAPVEPDLDAPEAPAPPISQARAKAMRASQARARKPSSQEGQEMARGIRMAAPALRGQINMLNDKLKGANLATLRRINVAVDRIVGPEASVAGPEAEVGDVQRLPSFGEV